MVGYIKSLKEFDELIEASESKLVVVDFTASWCGPCRMISPVMDQLEQEYTNVKFVKVDVDDADEIASKAGIRAMPTFHFYKGGEKIEEFKGANVGKLKQFVAKYA